MSDADLGIGIGISLGLLLLAGVLLAFVYEPLEAKVGLWWQRRREAKQATHSGRSDGSDG